MSCKTETVLEALSAHSGIIVILIFGTIALSYWFGAMDD